MWHYALFYTSIEWVSVFLLACLFYRFCLLSLDFNFFSISFFVALPIICWVFWGLLYKYICVRVRFPLLHTKSNQFLLLYARSNTTIWLITKFYFNARVLFSSLLLLKLIVLKTYRLFRIQRILLTRFILFSFWLIVLSFVLSCISILFDL